MQEKSYWSQLHGVASPAQESEQPSDPVSVGSQSVLSAGRTAQGSATP
jgi:hypothetical protein